MFGELGPRLKGGFNNFLVYLNGSLTTFKTVAGQDLQINAGDAVPTYNAFGTAAGGRSVTVQGSNAIGNSVNGGGVTVQGGTAVGATSTTGGAVTMQGGYGGSLGGPVTLQGGQGGLNGGLVNIKSGTGLNVNTGGAISITTALSGPINITNQSSQNGTDNSQSAGGISLTAGSTVEAGTPGNINITAGSSLASGLAWNKNGGSVNITGGDGGYQNTNGGGVNLTAGTGKGTGNGADIKLTSGAAAGSGARGNIVLNGGNGAALAVGATGGFVQLPTMAGTPTGTPASITTGCVPMVFDTTNIKLWAYTGGSWQSAGGGVASFNTRTGAVTLQSSDISGASGALLTDVAAAKYYDAQGGAPGAVTASQLLLQHIAGRTLNFPASLTGSRGYAGTAPTGAVTIQLSVFTPGSGATNVGTINFAAGSQTATFTAASGFTVNPGQVLQAVAPASADATLANVSFTLLSLAT